MEHAREPAAEAHLVIAALGRRNVVDEGEQALGKFARMLNGELDENAVPLPLVIQRLRVELALALVEVGGKIGNASRIAEGHGIRLRPRQIELLRSVLVALFHIFVRRDALVCQSNGKPLVEEGKLFQTVRNGGELELRRGEHRVVRHEMHKRAVLRLCTLARLFERRNGDARFVLLFLLVVVGMERHLPGVAVLVDAHLQPLGERVRNRSAHAVQTARKRIVVFVKLAARMQLSKDDLYARDLGLGVDVGGNAAPVVLYGRAAVLIDAHVDPVAIPVRRLVDGVVHDLPEDVVQSAHARGTDICRGAGAPRPALREW